MKWLFALLVLANIGLFMWASWYRESDAVVAGERAPVHPEKMRLLTEPGAQPRPRAAKPVETKNESAGVAATGAGCYRIGPFGEPTQVEKAAARLKELQLAYERRTEEQRITTGYRVYLPPFASRELAEKKRRELARLGFHDHSVIQEEGWQNAVSLGMFSVEANAQKRLQSLAARGIEARMQVLESQRTQHWLRLSPGEYPAETLAALRSAEWGASGAALQDAACPAESKAPQP